MIQPGDSQDDDKIIIPFNYKLINTKNKNRDKYYTLDFNQNNHNTNDDLLLNFMLDNSQSSRQYMLVSGFSGSGKSQFRKQIKQYLWQYNELKRKRKLRIVIPLLINLKKDLIYENQIKQIFLESESDLVKRKLIEEFLNNENQDQKALYQPIVLADQIDDIDAEFLIQFHSLVQMTLSNHVQQLKIIYFIQSEQIKIIRDHKIFVDFQLATPTFDNIVSEDKLIFFQTFQNTLLMSQFISVYDIVHFNLGKIFDYQINTYLNQSNYLTLRNIIYEIYQQTQGWSLEAFNELWTLSIKILENDMNDTGQKYYLSRIQLYNIFEIFQIKIQDPILFVKLQNLLKMEKLKSIIDQNFLKQIIKKPALIQIFYKTIHNLVSIQNNFLFSLYDTQIIEIFSLCELNIQNHPNYYQIFQSLTFEALKNDDESQNFAEFSQNLYIKLRNHLEYSNYKIRFLIQKPIINYLIAKQYLVLLEQLDQIDKFDIKNTSNYENIKNTDFGKLNLSNQILSDVPKFLKDHFVGKESAQMKLLNIIKASSVVENFELEASNAFAILKSLNLIIRNQDFRGIRIKNTNLNDFSFIECNLTNSQMDNVEINRTHFISCNMESIYWKNMKRVDPIFQIKSPKQKQSIRQVAISSDNNILAYMLNNEWIIFQQLQTEKKYKKWKINNFFHSLSFSYKQYFIFYGDNNQLIFRSVFNDKILRKWKKQNSLQFDKQILCWDIETGKLIAEIDDHLHVFCSQINVKYHLVVYCPSQKIIFFGKLLRNNFTLKSVQQNQIFRVTSCEFSQKLQQLISNQQINEFFLIFSSNCLKRKIISKKIQLFDKNANFIASSFDGSLWVVRQNSEQILIYDANNIQRMTQQKINLEQKEEFYKFYTDGQIIIRINNHNKIQFQSIKTGIVISGFDKYNSKITCLSISKNEKLIATGCEDSKIILWHLEDRQYIGTLSGHTSMVICLVFHNIKQMLASNSYDGSIILWNIKCMSIINVFNASYYQEIFFQPNGVMLATRDQEKNYQIWNTETLQEIKIQNVLKQCGAIAFSPDNRTVVVAKNFNQLYFYDLRNQQQSQILEDNDNNSVITSLDFSLNNKKLVSIKKNGIVSIFTRVRSNNWNKSFQLNSQCNINNHIIFYKIQFLADNRTLVAGTTDGDIFFFNVKIMNFYQILFKYDNMNPKFAYAPDGNQLAFTINERIQLINLKTLKSIKKFTLHSHSINFITYSPNGKLIASASNDNTIVLSEIDSGAKDVLSHHSQAVIIVQFSLTGQYLASGSLDQTVALWNIQDKIIQWQKKGHEDTVNAIAFNYNEKILVSGGDKKIILWNIQRGIIIFQINIDYNLIFLTVSPIPLPSLTLITLSKDKVISIISYQTEKAKTLTQFQSKCTTPLRFTIDGEFLLFGTQDGQIEKWNVERRQLVDIFEGHQNKIVDLSIIQNGQAMISLSLDTIRVWKIEDGSTIVIKFLSGLTQILENKIGAICQNNSLRHAKIISQQGNKLLKLKQISY